MSTWAVSTADKTNDGVAATPRELDACFALHAGEKLGGGGARARLRAQFPQLPPEAVATHTQRLMRRFHSSVYKWVRSPLGLRIRHLDLDRERALHLPVVSSPEWLVGRET